MKLATPCPGIHWKHQKDIYSSKSHFENRTGTNSRPEETRTNKIQTQMMARNNENQSGNQWHRNIENNVLKSKSWFSEKTKRNISPTSQKGKKVRTQRNKIISYLENIITGLKEIQNIIRKYFRNLKFMSRNPEITWWIFRFNQTTKIKWEVDNFRQP